MDNFQFKAYIELQLKDRLERLAAKCGYGSAQQFVIEALDLYAETLADLILELRKVQGATVKRQREQLLADVSQGQEPGGRK